MIFPPRFTATCTGEFNLLDLQCTGDASESGLIKFVQILRDVKEYRCMIKQGSTVKCLGTCTRSQARPSAASHTQLSWGSLRSRCPKLFEIKFNSTNK